jgi:hypothetical protein
MVNMKGYWERVLQGEQGRIRLVASHGWCAVCHLQREAHLICKPPHGV